MLINQRRIRRLKKQDIDPEEEKKELMMKRRMKNKSTSSIFLARLRNKQFMMKTQSMFKDICEKADFC